MLAIHTKSGSFAAGWVRYCTANGVPYKEVDCFADDIVGQLQGCRALLWHWQHHDYRASLFARQLIASLETAGLPVFPATSTAWHYDDKVGQKYLLEAVGAPLIPSHVFFEQASAIRWLETADFPLVWKLRSGAGSRNVRLVRTLREAHRIVKRSFGRGWRASRLHPLRERMLAFRRKPSLSSLVDLSRGVGRVIFPHEKYRNQSAERNYVYFQEFIADNDHDVRVVVIGDRAFAIKRRVRENDFRASGSGLITHDPDFIPEECIKISFEVTAAIRSQCCALDLVREGDSWKVVEISYAFSLAGYLDCPGYWTADMKWHGGEFRPEYFMIEDVLSRLDGGSAPRA